MKLKDCKDALEAGGRVTCPELKGAFVQVHPAEGDMRVQIVYPKGHVKYPNGTYRLFEREGNEKACDSENWTTFEEKKEG